MRRLQRQIQGRWPSGTGYSQAHGEQARKSHQLSSRGRRDSAVAGRIWLRSFADRKSACALAFQVDHPLGAGHPPSQHEHEQGEGNGGSRDPMEEGRRGACVVRTSGSLPSPCRLARSPDRPPLTGRCSMLVQGRFEHAPDVGPPSREQGSGSGIPRGSESEHDCMMRSSWGRVRRSPFRRLSGPRHP